MIGCIVDASIIAPVLNLLYEAYGFVGHLPGEGMNETNALNDPQVILMNSIAEGIFKNTFNWPYIRIGVILGLFIFLNFLSKKKKLSLPPLAIGMGVYLPPIVTIPIFLGSLLVYFDRKRVAPQDQQDFKHKGILLVSGLIVREGLMGIILAGLIVISVSNGSDGKFLDLSFLAQGWGEIIGLFSFIAILIFIYKHLTCYKKGS